MEAIDNSLFEFLYPDNEGSTASSEEASNMSDDGGSELEEIHPRVPGSPSPSPLPADDNVHQRSTALKLSQLNEDKTYAAVKQTTAMMEATGINLPIYLDALSWGNAKCTKDPSIWYQHSALMHSRELPGLLEQWRKPPRSSASITRPSGATQTMNEFALAATIDVINRELKELGPSFRLRAGEDVNAEQLTEVGIGRMISRMKETAPKFWQLLAQSLTFQEARKKKGEDQPEKV
ncbi:hypothetical protein EST38_g13692 [Candolleomyces aberdarensis]|uniref:Uncharacterized protein n=1 Tax=Candolleomyces aberdarensis TaxID=2316362 RepID=A0A4Q2D1K3_9AGAR|nr:hypothetical protein EST38_g13692 [Candolleomyces aberdarensis]